MADRVIIVGVRRNRKRVPAAELCQMAGRVARSHTSKTANVDVVVGESEIDDMPSIFEAPQRFVIESLLDDTKELCFHLIPEIVQGRVGTILEAEQWYSRSLAAALGQKPNFLEVFSELLRLESVVQTNGRLVPTVLGNLCVRFYFSPYDIFAWKQNFTDVFDMELEEDDTSVAWAIANVPSERRQMDISKFRYIVYDYDDQIKSHGLEFDMGSLPMATLWWSAMGGTHITRMSGELARMRKDYGRIHQVFVVLNDYLHWDMTEFFDDLFLRFHYRIPQELVALCRISAISKNEAQQLHEIGVTSPDEIEDSLSVIEGSCSDRLVSKMKRLIHGFE